MCLGVNVCFTSRVFALTCVCPICKGLDSSMHRYKQLLNVGLFISNQALVNKYDVIVD